MNAVLKPPPAIRILRFAPLCVVDTVLDASASPAMGWRAAPVASDPNTDVTRNSLRFMNVLRRGDSSKGAARDAKRRLVGTPFSAHSIAHTNLDVFGLTFADDDDSVVVRSHKRGSDGTYGVE